MVPKIQDPKSDHMSYYVVQPEGHTTLQLPTVLSLCGVGGRELSPLSILMTKCKDQLENS